MARRILQNSARIERPNALRIKVWQKCMCRLLPSLAVVAVVDAHRRLAIQHSARAPPRLLGVLEVALALGLKAAEPGWAVPCVVRT